MTMKILSALSIRAVLGILVGLLTLILVAMGGMASSDAYSQWREADRAERLISLSRMMFESLSQFRVERDTAMTALAQQPAADTVMTREMAQRRQFSEESFKAAMTALEKSDFPDRADLTKRLSDAHEAVAVLRPKLDKALSLPKEERDISLESQWIVAGMSYHKTVSGVVDLLDSSYSVNDHRIGQLMAIKRAAWSARDNAGLVTSRMEKSAAQNRSWSIPEIIAATSDDGKAGYAWAMISSAIAHAEVPASVQEAITQGNGYFSGPVSNERRNLIGTLSMGGTLTVSPTELWRHDLEALSLW